MPNLYKNILGKLRRPSSPELNALVLGLDNAGKSSVLSRIISDNAEDLNSIIPTVGMDEKHIKMKNMKVCLRDVSGHWRSRQLWHSFFAETNVLVYVVDSTDTSRLSEAQCELCDVLLDKRLSKVPLLVLANKQDLPQAVPSDLLVEFLGLKRIVDRDWQMEECSAVANTGIYKSTVWIYDNLRKQHPSKFFDKLISSSLFFGPTCFLNCRKPSTDIS